MKKIYFIFLVLFVVNINLWSEEWISFDNSDNTTPEYILMQSNNSFVEFEVTIPGMNSFDIDSFQRVSIPEHTRMDSIGNPEVPIVSFLIAIPECGDIDLNIAVLDSTIIDSINIYPAPELIEVTAPEGYTYLEEQFTINNTLYNIDEYFPGYAGELVDRGAVRAQHCIRINIYPVQFNPVQQEIVAYSKLNIHITFSDLVGSINEDVGIFNEVCGHSMINYNSNGLNASINCGAGYYERGNVKWLTHLDSLFMGDNSVHCDYLIVTHHDFWNNQYIQQLADKRADYNGLNVVIVKMSDIHNQVIGDYPDEKLKILIQNTYNNGIADHTFDNKLGYVNLFGDTQMQNLAQNPVPTHEEGNDSYFAELTIPPGTTEPDPYPDIMIGRCSVDNTQQVENVVTKTLNYEPLEANPVNGWRNRTLTLLGTEIDFYNLYETGLVFLNNTFNDYANNIFAPPEYLSNNTIPNNFILQNPYTFLNYKDYFLDENIFVNYMGHGGTGIWGTSWLYSYGVYYSGTNGICNSFITDTNFPLVTSFACLTGAFQNVDDCMAEKFLCSSSNSGSISFIGSSIVTNAHSFDITCPLFYENLVDNCLYVIGEALLATKLQDLYMGPDYNLIGDPAINYFIDTENVGLPDLKIENNYINHEFGYPNYQNCFLEISILNHSPVDIDDPFDIEIYYKESSSSTDSTHIYTETVTNLSGAENHIINYIWNPGIENLGYKYITVNVDRIDAIDERSEINNYAIKEIVITNEIENFPIVTPYITPVLSEVYCDDILNNDGINEIVVSHNLIHPTNMNNSWFNDDKVLSLVLGDLNDDGEKEIYLFSYVEETIHRININDGSIEESYNIGADDAIVVFSTDKEQLYSLESINDEIFLKTYDYNLNSTILNEFTEVSRLVPIPPTLCDINYDGYKEIGVLVENGIYVYDGFDGELIFYRPINARDMVFTDLNKDGIWELITNDFEDNNGKIVIYDPLNNNELESITFNNEEIYSIISSDTDNDGFPEIVFTTDLKLRILDIQGTAPSITCEIDINGSLYGNHKCEIISGNINSDLDNEVIINDCYTYGYNDRVCALTIEPSTANQEYIIFPDDIESICLSNIDNNSDLELISTSNNIVNSFDFIGGSNNIEWGQYRNDIYNSGCYDTRIYDLPENSDIIWSNKIIIKGQIELPSSSTLTIIPGTIITPEEESELIVFGSIIAEGTEDRPIIFKAQPSNAGNQYWSGITLLNRSLSSFKYCEIENAEYAILYEDIESENHTFENCLIKDNYTGIGVYSSSPVIKENIIRDNTIGIACFNDSSPILTDLGPTGQPFRNGIINNTLGICIDYSLPYINNGYNDIYSTSRDNYIEMHNDDVNLRASQNYWGTTDIEEIYNHLLPPESYSIIPVLDTPQSSYIPPRDAQFEMIKNAYIYLENQDYSNAELTFKDIIETYPETSEAYLAISGLFICTKKSNGSWNDYELYLNQVAQDSLISEKFTKLVDCYYNLSKREQEEYDTAIANYESVLLNNPSYQDSCYAVIDIGNTYIEAGFNGRGASGKFSNLQPKSVIHHAKETRKLLFSIFNPEQYPPATPEIYKYSLYQNYPNPFNPSTTISFSLPKESKTEISIYNIKGQKVRTLIKNKLEAGNHSVIWYGKDSSGKEVGSGIYFYKLKVNGKDKPVKKCLLLK